MLAWETGVIFAWLRRITMPVNTAQSNISSLKYWLAGRF